MVILNEKNIPVIDLAQFYENSTAPETCVLVGIDTGEYDAYASIDELEELASTAGASVFAKLIQKRDKPDNATYLGEGKLWELKNICDNNDVDLLIFDGELTPSQQRNIEKFTDIRTIDRTMLILDIFALNARTGEGKLQVELAQLKYSLPRLGGKGTEMSRLGGGIGTRGPGESKLESDRRHIHRRINSLDEQLKTLSKRRKLLRERRKKNAVTTVAIVGYTNAGKSTLLNALTDAGVLAENKLFATLDPTSRALRLPDGRTVLLVDTVGFISRLPHDLVEAFKSTLEEVVYADLILNICDASDPAFEEHLSVTKRVVNELGASDKPMLTVYNKCDKAPNLRFFGETGNDVRISALKKIGFDNLLTKICDSLEKTRRKVRILLPYSDGSTVSVIRREGAVIKEEYREDGIFVEAILDGAFLNTIEKYILPEEDEKEI
ncbi:MAG: GTPase HflX [Clostridia bacterium]|nr:GTPase HflX [Clostridia bacterium]